MRAICAVFAVSLPMLIVTAAFAAETSAPADADAASLVIEAGRLVVMVDQSEEALALLAPALRVEDGDAAPRQDAYAFYELVAAVSRYNVVVDRACSAGLVAAKLCDGPYQPVWLKDASNVEHGNQALRAMIDDASAHIEPFWTDICARGKRAAKDEAFCRIE